MKRLLLPARSNVLLVLPMVCVLPPFTAGYIGPGAGLSAIGAFLAVFAGIVLALFGFVWYPVKRLLRKKKPAADPADGAGE